MKHFLSFMGALALPLALLLGVLAAQAQITPPSLSLAMPVPAAGGTYTGIGDLSVPGTPLAYWGGDCYTKTGTRDIFKVDNSTTTNTTIVTCTPGGVYGVVSGEDSLATIESDCGGTNVTACTATYIYDQTQSLGCGTSAACDVQQTTAANQPYLIYSNGTNCKSITAGLFCFSFAHGTTDSTISVNHAPTAAQPINIACVGQYAGGNELFMQTTSSAIQMDVNTTFFAYAGTYVGPATSVSTTNWSTFFASFDGATASLAQLNNGTPVTTNSGTGTFANTDSLEFGAQADNWTGYLGACFVSTATVFGNTGVGNMFSNWQGRWGAGI